MLYLLKIYSPEMKNKLNLSLIILAIIVSLQTGLAAANFASFEASIPQSYQVSNPVDVSFAPSVRVDNITSQNKALVVAQPSFCKIELNQSSGQIQFQTTIELHQSADCFSLSLGSVSVQKTLAVVDSQEKELKVNVPKPIVRFASISQGSLPSALEQAIVPNINFVYKNQSDLSHDVPVYLFSGDKEIQLDIFTNSLSLLQVFRC